MKDFKLDLETQVLQPAASVSVASEGSPSSCCTLSHGYDDNRPLRIGPGRVTLLNEGQTLVRADLLHHSSCDDEDGDDVSVDGYSFLSYLEPSKPLDLDVPAPEPWSLGLRVEPACRLIPWSKPGQGVRAKNVAERRRLGLADEWEHLLYTYLGASGVPFERVPEGHSRTPDFLVKLQGSNVPVELKTLAPEEAPTGEPNSRELGRGLVRRLEKARGQVRPYSKAGHPTIVVVTDLNASGFVSPDDVAAALVGHMVATISASDSGVIVSDVARRPDARRVPTHALEHISAVGVLSAFPALNPHSIVPPAPLRLAVNLVLYHNPMASVRLPLGHLSPFLFPQYIVSEVPPRRAFVSSL